MNQQVVKIKKQYEEEVRLRIEFEKKINNLNNYNRKLQTDTKTMHTSFIELDHKLKLESEANLKLELLYLEFKTKLTGSKQA